MAASSSSASASASASGSAGAAATASTSSTPSTPCRVHITLACTPTLFTAIASAGTAYESRFALSLPGIVDSEITPPTSAWEHPHLTLRPAGAAAAAGGDAATATSATTVASPVASAPAKSSSSSKAPAQPPPPAATPSPPSTIASLLPLALGTHYWTKSYDVAAGFSLARTLERASLLVQVEEKSLAIDAPPPAGSLGDPSLGDAAATSLTSPGGRNAANANKKDDGKGGAGAKKKDDKKKKDAEDDRDVLSTVHPDLVAVQDTLPFTRAHHFNVPVSTLLVDPHSICVRYDDQQKSSTTPTSTVLPTGTPIPINGGSTVVLFTPPSPSSGSASASSSSSTSASSSPPPSLDTLYPFTTPIYHLPPSLRSLTVIVHADSDPLTPDDRLALNPTLLSFRTLSGLSPAPVASFDLSPVLYRPVSAALFSPDLSNTPSSSASTPSSPSSPSALSISPAHPHARTIDMHFHHVVLLSLIPMHTLVRLAQQPAGQSGFVVEVHDRDHKSAKTREEAEEEERIKRLEEERLIEEQMQREREARSKKRGGANAAMSRVGTASPRRGAPTSPKAVATRTGASAGATGAAAVKPLSSSSSTAALTSSSSKARVAAPSASNLAATATSIATATQSSSASAASSPRDSSAPAADGTDDSASSPTGTTTTTSAAAAAAACSPTFLSDLAAKQRPEYDARSNVYGRAVVPVSDFFRGSPTFTIMAPVLPVFPPKHIHLIPPQKRVNPYPDCTLTVHVRMTRPLSTDAMAHATSAPERSPIVRLICDLPHDGPGSELYAQLFRSIVAHNASVFAYTDLAFARVDMMGRSGKKKKPVEPAVQIASTVAEPVVIASARGGGGKSKAAAKGGAGAATATAAAAAAAAAASPVTRPGTGNGRSRANTISAAPPGVADDASSTGLASQASTRPGTGSNSSDATSHAFEPLAQVLDPTLDDEPGDFVSGLQVCDGHRRVVILESLAPPSSTAIDRLHNELCRARDALGAHHSDASSSSSSAPLVHILYHPELTFPSRLYSVFPLTLKHVRLHTPLARLSFVPPTTTRSIFSPDTSIFNTLSQLASYRRTYHRMREVHRTDAFPTAHEVIRLEKMFGQWVSDQDVEGVRVAETTYDPGRPLRATAALHTVLAASTHAAHDQHLEDLPELPRAAIESCVVAPSIGDAFAAVDQEQLDGRRSGSRGAHSKPSSRRHRASSDSATTTATTVLPVSQYIYANHRLNPHHAAAAVLRDQCHADPHAYYTYSMDYLSGSIPAYGDERTFQRQQELEERTHWRTPAGFNLVTFTPSSFTNSQRPVSQLTEPWTEAHQRHSSGAGNGSAASATGVRPDDLASLSATELEAVWRDMHQREEERACAERRKHFHILPLSSVESDRLLSQSCPDRHKSIHEFGVSKWKEELKRKQEEKEEWRRKVIVEDTKFHILWRQGGEWKEPTARANVAASASSASSSSSSSASDAVEADAKDPYTSLPNAPRFDPSKYDLLLKDAPKKQALQFRREHAGKTTAMPLERLPVSMIASEPWNDASRRSAQNGRGAEFYGLRPTAMSRRSLSSDRVDASVSDATSSSSAASSLSSLESSSLDASQTKPAFVGVFATSPKSRVWKRVPPRSHAPSGVVEQVFERSY